MAVATHVYFDVIKLLLGFSFAALPLLATVLGLGREQLNTELKPLVVWTVAAFVLSMALGVTALLLAAKRFRDSAYEHDKELRGFLGKCVQSLYNPDVLEEYFARGTEKAVQEGMFWELQLGWFFGQIGTFIVGMCLFLWVIFSSL